MKLDESSLAESLHDATSNLTVNADFGSQVRRRGTRRLRRRQIGTTFGVAMVVAGIVPAAIALAPTSRIHDAASVRGGPSPAASAPSFPPARSCTDSGPGGAAPVSAYPNLLMLPKGQQRVAYAFTNSGGAPRCAYFPHVALTLLHQQNGFVTRGVVIEGPNAPSALQDGRGGPNTEFSGTTLHFEIDGHQATGYYIVRRVDTPVYWSDSDGSQWRATTRGLNPPAIRTLLNDISYDAQTGGATLPNANPQGWTVAPAAPDASGDTSGVFYGLWHVSGSKAALWVAPGPDRLDQQAADGVGARFTEVNGRTAVVYRGGSVMRWQPSQGITAYLSMTHSSLTKIEQVAESIVPVGPNDPRLYRPGPGPTASAPPPR